MNLDTRSLCHVTLQVLRWWSIGIDVEAGQAELAAAGLGVPYEHASPIGLVCGNEQVNFRSGADTGQKVTGAML